MYLKVIDSVYWINGLKIIQTGMSSILTFML